MEKLNSTLQNALEKHNETVHQKLEKFEAKFERKIEKAVNKKNRKMADLAELEQIVNHLENVTVQEIGRGIIKEVEKEIKRRNTVSEFTLNWVEAGDVDIRMDGNGNYEKTTGDVTAPPGGETLKITEIQDTILIYAYPYSTQTTDSTVQIFENGNLVATHSHNWNGNRTYWAVGCFTPDREFILIDQSTDSSPSASTFC